MNSASPASPYRLQLFGNRSLVGPQGVPLTGQAVQRHRIALLALLALTPERAIGRDKLMGYIWPERGPEQARQLLNQAVYNLRKALGDDAILSDGDDLRLNPEVVGSDVTEFEAALARQDHAEAVRLYSAPFLDGFSLGEAPEFEWWVDRERQRLAAAHARALEALAETASQNRDLPGAVEWWKARATQDPYDARVTMRLMEALAASGNRAGALQQAKVHERLLETEFGAAPSPEVLTLAEQLRSAPVAPVASVVEPSRTKVPNDVATLAPYEPPAGPLQAPLPAATTTRRSRRAIGYGLAALAVVVAATVALRLRATRHEPAPLGTGQPSLAVLPLTNLSPDPRDASLADGMTEELIGTLAKEPNLRVIASTSVFAFRDRRLDVRSIAESLHVRQILEGDVQKNGTHLRVRVRLVDAHDGGARWSETYTRELSDVFAVQDDIARAVTQALGLQLGSVAKSAGSRHQTHSIAAYELYLRGTDPVLLRSDSGAQAALDYFRQATAVDSTYAAAYAGESRMYLRLSLSGAAGATRRDRLALGEQFAAKALALDDSLADAYATTALLRLARFDLRSAESHLRRAVDLEPSRAAFHEWLTRLYVIAERPAEALAEGQRALELDPLSPSANAELARALLANGRTDDALAQIRKVAALRPPLLRANIIAAHCYIKKGMWSQAIGALRAQGDRGGPTALAHLGYALAHTGQRAEALRIRAMLVQRWQHDFGGELEVALVSAGLGDIDQAFAWLDRAMAGGLLNPDDTVLLFDALQHDPRFDRVRQRLGI